MTNLNLQGLRVLLTRPHPHNDSLQTQLEQAGAQVRTLPMLVIEALPQTQELRQQLMNLDLYNAVIVVSPNAARLGLAAIDTFWPQLPLGIDWLTVGEGTAAVLRAEGLEVLVPRDGHDSEALLRLARLQQVQGERILILRGEGGRDLLAKTLRERGARVEFAELYRRAPPQHSAQDIRAAVQEFEPHFILLFSGETFEHLAHMCQANGFSLQQTQLWLPSERAAETARSRGLNRLHVMQALDDLNIVQALGEWHHRAE